MEINFSCYFCIIQTAKKIGQPANSQSITGTRRPKTAVTSCCGFMLIFLKAVEVATAFNGFGLHREVTKN